MNANNQKNYDDYIKSVKIGLENLLTIPEKLDFLDSIHVKSIIICMNAIGERFVSPLFIPETIYKEHFGGTDSDPDFGNNLNNPEFTYWFLKFHAQRYFDVILELNKINEKINTPIAKEFIKAELKTIVDFEQRADSLLYESKFDIYQDKTSEFRREIEYTRIRADYYKKHSLHDVHAITHPATIAYCNHKYYKSYLGISLDRLEQRFINGHIASSEKVNPMEAKQGKIILIESLYHTERTRPAFFINKAKEMNINPVTFYLELTRLYNELESQVNEKDYTAWSEDENGNKEYPTKTINLLRFTDNKISGHLNSNNIKEILPGLYEFGQMVKQSVTEQQSKSDKEKKSIKGFECNLTDTQINNLYVQMQDYFKGDYESFKAIFRPKTILSNFDKVVWLKRPTHLREFLSLINIPPTQKIVKELISDEKGNEIVLPKINRTKLSPTYWEMEVIVKPILEKSDLKNIDK